MDSPSQTALEARVQSLTRPDSALLIYYAVVSLTSLVFSPIVLIPLYFHYHTLHYAFDGEGISMGYGILFRREVHLTYARMQDIHLSQDILERWLGIGTVTVQTAGGGAAGDLKIKGVRDFEAIRDYLYSRMRGVKATKASASTDPEANLLAEIRDELRAATRALSKSHGAP